MLGQWGAWGYYVDGCTVRLGCPSTRAWCLAERRTNFGTFRQIGLKVTQNARLRAFNNAGQVTWFNDGSCSGIDSCATPSARVYIAGGQSASVQCNGVQAQPQQQGVNVCRIDMWYL